MSDKYEKLFTEKWIRVAEVTTLLQNADREITDHIKVLKLAYDLLLDLDCQAIFTPYETTTDIEKQLITSYYNFLTEFKKLGIGNYQEKTK